MEKNDICQLMHTLLPKLYSFAYALGPDEVFAEQLIIDAYTLMIMKDEDIFLSEDYDLKNVYDRKILKKYLFKEMLSEMYELAMKREKPNWEHVSFEYQSFYQLKPSQRALIFLKEKCELLIEDLQEVFTLQRFQVLENYHNAKSFLLSHDQQEKSLEDENMTLQNSAETSRDFLVRAYVNKTIKLKDIPLVEKMIGEDNQLQALYTALIEEQNFLQDLVLEKKCIAENIKNIHHIMEEVTVDILPETKKSLVKRISEFLDKPILTIDY
ncbi:MAG: hypothetical protein QF441_06925 [Bacteriovoracaceae bacterium]|jgi:hypothetical protein|nr:hypothetical protein [Bacteriovoracaceae bacterium]